MTKIIDSLHISNHKDVSCREKYDPGILKKEIREGNTMAAEQTFVWLSRFKKNLCAIPRFGVRYTVYIVCGILLRVTKMERSLCYQRHATNEFKESTCTPVI